MSRGRMLQVCAVDFTAVHLLRPLLHASRADGWDVEFACSDGPGADALRSEGFAHRPIPMSRSRSPIAQFRAFLALTRSLRRDRPDLVHTHTPAGGLVGRAAAVGAGVPHIVHTFHGLPFERGPRGPVEMLYLQIERQLSRHTDLFFSQARGDVDRAVGWGIARPEELMAIGNGVDVSRFLPDPDQRRAVRHEFGVPEEAVLAVTVARLVREKGLLELADAALQVGPQLPLQVLVIGEALPSDRTSIAEALSRHPVATTLGTRWRMLGARSDVNRLLQAADLFVLPTYREGLPRSIIEAMASGLAVIASDIPACRELVRDGVTGILVPPRDTTSLGAALRLLIIDERKRKEMGRIARDIAIVEHDERRILKRQLEALGRFSKP